MPYESLALPRFNNQPFESTILVNDQLLEARVKKEDNNNAVQSLLPSLSHAFVPLSHLAKGRPLGIPPAKPKRHFDYFNLNCGDRNALITLSDCSYIDDALDEDTPTRQLVAERCCDNNNCNGNNDKSSGLNNRDNFFLRNLRLFTALVANQRDKLRSVGDDFNMNELAATAPPIPPQRYHYRMENASEPPFGTFVNGCALSSSRMMSPVLEESEQNFEDEENESRRCITAPASDSGDHDTNSEHLYGRVRRLPLPSTPHDFNGDEDEKNPSERLDYNAFTNSYSEDVPPLSFANFNKKYSMGGVNGRIQDVATQHQQPPRQAVVGGGGGGSTADNRNANKSVNATATRRCCTRFVAGLEAGVLLIATLELLFIVYQTIFASLAYDKTGDENAFAFTLTLFSFVLAIVAVILLLVGVQRRSPYFLVPHLLMQFAVFSTTFALSVYFTLLLIGGTSVTIDSIFYEDSSLGELGLTRASTLQPQKLSVVAHGLNTILIALLICTLVFFFVQVWFFAIVRRCYKLFYHLSMEKESSAIASSTNGVEAPPKLSSASTTTPASLGTTANALPSSRHHYAYQNNI